MQSGAGIGASKRVNCHGRHFGFIRGITLSVDNGGEESAGGADGYATEGVKVEEVAVAAYDVGGVAAEGQFEELVIFGVAASGDGVGNLYRLNSLENGSKKFIPLLPG